ncbi:MAG: mechanosensitive ion channel [Candidatus Omnitrophota bacterium]|nr:MAG: mechanosensitive ion channel [Candidatus Omnitrophota bacterium]
MKNMRNYFYFVFKVCVSVLSLTLFFGFLGYVGKSHFVFAQTINIEPKRKAVTSEEPTVEESIEAAQKKKMEAEAAKVQVVIEGQSAVVDEAQNEINKFIEKARVLEKEAVAAEKAIEVTGQKLQALNETAGPAPSAELAAQIKQLEVELVKLEAEAKLKRKEFEAAQKKANTAQKKLARRVARVEELKKKLDIFREQGFIGRTWLERLVRTAAILGVGLFFFLFIKIGLHLLRKRLKREYELRESEMILRLETLIRISQWAGGITIILIVGYVILEDHGFNVAPLLAGLGVAGLAFGFGGQYLIRDLINGLFILLEGQYRINDIIKIGEFGGIVEDVNLRITVLRDLEGRVITIPNGEIKTVVNYTKGYSQALFDIGVAYKESVDKVMGVIKEVGRQMREDSYFGRLILSDLEMFGVDDFADSAVIIKFRIKTRPKKQWEVRREFKRRLKNTFDEMGIEIPFPHRTLYWGEGDTNDWMRNTAEKMAK